MASNRNDMTHLLAGGVAGTVGAVATCPLEVVKTRLQSSLTIPTRVYIPSATPILSIPNVGNISYETPISYSSLGDATGRRVPLLGIYTCLRHIVLTEGVRGLFKGLGPNLVGVAPSRAIYFYSYARAKQYFNERIEPESHQVHILSSFTAGMTASTLTNPIWFVKTRLQLDQKREGNMRCRDCIERVYRTHGLSGFYKGISASYIGVSETVIHFVIYEELKATLLAYKLHDYNEMEWTDFLKCMVAGATSKTCATIIAYPHEVLRTRLREEGEKYKRFVQSFLLILREEGHKGLYKGLATQLVRQIPNTAILMSVYELVVYMFSRRSKDLT